MAQYDPAFTPLKKDEKKYDPAFTPLKPEDYALSGVEFEEKPLPEIKPDPPSLRFRGQALSDPNADWWEKLKGFGEVIDAMAGMSSRISGAEDVENKIAEDIPKIPFVKQAMQDFASGLSFEGKEAPKEGEVGKRAWNELVGMGIGGLGETLEDPRSYILPKVFGELGKKTTYSAKDLEYWREIYEKSRKPIQGGRVEVVGPKRLMGTYDPEGVGPITGLAPRFPKKPSGGRFLASPSGVANIRSALPLAAGAQAGEFSPPLDPTDTSRFPKTIISGTPNPPVPEGILNQEALTPPPAPQAQVPKGLIEPSRPETSQFGSRGNVAIFGPSTNRQVYEIADELASVLTKGIQDDPNVEKLLQEAEVAITQERDPAIIDDNLEQIKGYLGTAKSPDERELFGGLYDTAREKIAQSQATPGAVVRPRFKNVPKKSKFKGRDASQPVNIDPVTGITTDHRGEVIPSPYREYEPRWNELKDKIVAAGQGRGPGLTENEKNEWRTLSDQRRADVRHDRDLTAFGKPPEYRVTAKGTVIDLNTGEEMTLDEATNRSNLPKTKEDPNEPQEARTPSGGLTISTNTRRSADQLKKDYSGELTGIMVREAVQNALDAVKSKKGAGEVKVRLSFDRAIPGYDNQRHYIEVWDNGKGMTRDELDTVYTDLFESGKEGDSEATGGKGVGKATYMLGGDHFYMETVAVDPSTGKKVKHIFNATPNELHGDYHPVRLEVSDDTPTGTYIKTKLKLGSNIYRGGGPTSMLDDIRKYSRGLSNKFSFVETNFDSSDTTPNKWEPKFEPHDWNDPTKDKILGSKDFGHSSVDIILPSTAIFEKRKYITLGYLNNGMFQYKGTYSLGKEIDAMPDHVIVNVKPQVDEMDDNYPFPIQRESLKTAFDNKVDQLIEDSFATPAKKNFKAKVQEIYDTMSPVTTGFNTHRQAVFFDPGNRLTPAEKDYMVDSNTVKNIVAVADSFLNTIINSVGSQTAATKLERVGILLSPKNLAGLHVPNPSAPDDDPKSAVLIDPWASVALGGAKTPRDAARQIVVTLLHEYAHIDVEALPDTIPPFDLADIQDPRAAEFLHTYLKEVQEQGGINPGHGWYFIKRLGEAYVKTGIRKSLQIEDAIVDAISTADPLGGPGDRSYTTEFQGLLQLYNESRGRDAVTEDYLSGTGEQQRLTTGRERGTPSSIKDARLTPARNIWDETGAVNLGGPGGPPRYDSIPRRGTPPSEPSVQIDADIKDRMFGEGYLIPRAFGLVKGLVATGDLPPLLRQGGAYAGRKFWRQAAKQQFRSYASEGGHQRALAEIRAHELMQPQANGKTEAEEMGLDINAGRRGWGHQEEAMMGIEDAERLVGWMTRGKINPVKASNRAFHDTMDYLRLEAALQLKNNYRNYYDSFRRTIQTDGDRRYAASMNPASPVVKAKIGELVNSTSGRARFGLKERRTPKDIRIPGTTRWVNVPKPLADIPLWPDTPFERFAGVANLVLFSGRLAKSYVERYNRLLNPYSYMKADPVMRREYLKQLLSIGGARVVLTGLGAAFGGLLGTVSTSSEWGKSVMPGGKVAMDTTLGGGKYETFAARVLQGEYTNRRGETKGLGEGPYVPTGLDLVEDLGEGLASPAFRAAIEVLRKSEHFSGPQAAGQELGLRTVIDTTTPIIGQDMWDIITESPQYIPLLYPDAIGVGLTIRSGEEIK